MLAAPSVARAEWFYDWYCNGNCAPGELSKKGREGPFSTEQACEASRESNPWNQTVREPGNFGNVDSCHESGGSSSTGSTGGYVPPAGRWKGELRVFGGIRMPAFDNRVSSDQPLAGQTPDELRANASVEPGWLVGVQLNKTSWVTPYVEVIYFRNQISSQNVSLGRVSGGWFAVGASKSTELSRRVIAEGQLGVGLAIASFSPSAVNTETDSVSTATYMLETSVLLGLLPFGRRPRFDLRASAYLMPQRFEPTAVTSGGPQFDLGRLGVLFALGIVFY